MGRRCGDVQINMIPASYHATRESMLRAAADPPLEAAATKDGLDQFAACWKRLDDPRTGNAGRHDFYELLMIALCKVLCGGPGAVDMEEFARAKEPFLRGFTAAEAWPARPRHVQPAVAPP
jgi:hypothetical protein